MKEIVIFTIFRDFMSLSTHEVLKTCKNPKNVYYITLVMQFYDYQPLPSIFCVNLSAICNLFKSFKPSTLSFFAFGVFSLSLPPLP